MSKPYIAVFLLVVLTTACSKSISVTRLSTAPSVTPLPHTIDSLVTQTPTPLIVTATLAVVCRAPEPRVQVGQKVLVTVEDWDKLKLRTDPRVSPDNVLMDLDQYSQLKILEGPVCVSAPGASYWFWRVVVIPSGEEGWVAEGDETHYFIEKY